LKETLIYAHISGKKTNAGSIKRDECGSEKAARIIENEQA
jgi:hypothetical protein